jgi:S1-C subfamily serine protease
MVEHQREHSSSILVLMFVAGLILGGIVTAYVLYKQIGTLNDDISNLEGKVSGISGNQNIYIQNGTVYQNGTTAFSEIFDKVKDSVVLISGKTSNGTVQGSGFIYNFTGSLIVITNNHVVHGATGVSVTFSDGNGCAATVKGTDPYSDLAVLSVTGAFESEFKPLEIVDSSSLKVGNPVVAIGNPYGLTGSMTTGIVSALGRTITEDLAGGFAIANIIQTSTPINPGNSGGPLLNWNGSVVGITTAIVENSQGLGFAVPSNTIQKEIYGLVEFGSYNAHSYLGVQGTDIDYDTAQRMHTSVTYGWLIGAVVQNGPAANATTTNGTPMPVQVNDIIIGINGTRTINGDEMKSWVEANTVPKETMILTIARGNQTLLLSLVLGTRPAPPG